MWLLSLLLCVASLAAAESPVGAPVELANAEWRIQVAPGTLGVWASSPATAERFELAAPLPLQGPVSQLVTSRTRASWAFADSGLRVCVSLAGPELSVRMTSSATCVLVWPSTGGDARSEGLAVPVSEGFYLPSRDPFWCKFWRKEESFSASGGLSAPFWAVRGSGNWFTFILPNELRSELTIGPRNGQLRASLEHHFDGRDGDLAFEVLIHRTPGPMMPVESALVYRR